MHQRPCNLPHAGTFRIPPQLQVDFHTLAQTCGPAGSWNTSQPSFLQAISNQPQKRDELSAKLCRPWQTPCSWHSSDLAPPPHPAGLGRLPVLGQAGCHPEGLLWCHDGATASQQRCLCLAVSLPDPDLLVSLPSLIPDLPWHCALGK